MIANAAIRDYFRNRRILVAGGDGFLGQNAVNALSALSADITLLVRDSAKARQPAAGKLLAGDLKDLSVAKAAVNGQEIVFDFVGVTSAVYSNQNPILSLREECFPHLNLLTACSGIPSPPLIVFPSSRLVYGKPLYLPVDEDHPTRPTNIYGAHKIAVEHYLRIYEQTNGVPYLIFRISNPYGPYQAAKSKGYGIINFFIQLALRGESIRLFGDGSQIRDFVYVDDLMDILLCGIATPACHNQIFNLGGRNPISLRTAAEAIARAAGGTPVILEPWPQDYQAVETGDYVSSIDKLARFIDLAPSISFEDGLKRAIAAYRDQTKI
jgi:nucleoside-diphosphate-sugar epimerase